MVMEKRPGKALLVTGASGFLAGELLPRLLDAYREAKIYLLLRAESETQLNEKRHEILTRMGLDAAASERVVGLAGNVEHADLGLGTHYLALAGEIGEIYHSAANTRFDQKIEAARQINFYGTENLLKFAGQIQQQGHLSHFHHVSTAYVAGNRTGAIKESELECGQQFYNTYEQSKYESEQMLRAAMAELPITIYRPSIIAGDSRTGRTAHFFVIYEPMKWVYNGQLTFIPCRPETHLDIVPIDYVCDAMMAIGRQPSAIGQTYHLTSSPARGITMTDMIDLCVAEFNKFNAEQGKPPVPKPEIVMPEQFNKLSGTERKNSETFFQRAGQQMQRHMPYAVTEKDFDDSQTRAALAESGISCPPFRKYLPVVVRYALEKQFRS